MSNEQREFTPIAGRDASATFRGYVYQVDTTISRWLSLQIGEELQLECGEDIDRIQKPVLDCDQEELRLLEQVKYRGKPLTLNSPEALQALASFVQHRTNNPDRRISFLYVTNSKAAREYKSPLLTDEPGIEVWMRVFREELSGDERTAALEGIRALLGRARKPAKVDGSLWKGFQEFIVQSNDPVLLEYIKSFEWNVQAPSFSRMPDEIKAELLRSGRAPSTPASEALYEGLFLFVIKKLASRGPKVLTPHELTAVISKPAIEPIDTQVLGVIRFLIGSVEERLRSLEEKAIEGQEYLKRMDVNLSLLASSSGFRGTVEYAAQIVPLDIPPLVDRAARRSATVRELVKVLEQKAWCALDGEIGSGKTQFVILIVTALKRRTFWVGFRNLDIAQSSARLDSALAAASGIRPTLEFRKWYSEVCRALGPGSVIVLDDLPRRTADDDFDARLLLLSEACNGNGCTLISASNEELPPTVTERVRPILVTDKIPLFNDEDVKELFLAYGAPPRLLNEKFVAFLRSLARGHPLLLTAIARYLISTGWRINDSQLQGLFRGEYADDLKPHIRQLLTTTVNAPKARELLYRLNLAGFSFGDEDVRLVSEVKPRIDLPMEKLAEAQGLWIQRDSGSKYLVSPLLSNLGSLDLSPATQRSVHEALGLNIMSKRKLGPFEVISAFSHFSSAEQNERAATVLIFALSYLSKLEKLVKDDWLITSIWAEQPLPEEIGLTTRLILRSLQVIARRRLGKDFRYALDDFDTAFGLGTDKDAAGIVGGGIGLAIDLAIEDPARANRYLLKAVQLEPAFLLPDGRRPQLPSRFRPELLFLSTALAIRSDADLRDWIHTVEQLEPSTLRKLFDSDFGEGANTTLCDHLWLEEGDKSTESQNWDAVLGQLRMLGEFAERRGAQLLWASSVRAQIIVLSEYKKRLADADTLAKEAMAKLSDDSRSLFLIHEAIGRQFAYAEQWSEALTWLDRAVNLGLKGFGYLRMRALLTASQAASKADLPRAIGYCERAVALAESSDQIPELQVVVALGEKAIAHWRAGDRLATYNSWEAAVERLLAAKSEQESWKNLFLISGHVSGYFSSMAKTGKPPETAFEYKVPEPGMFLADYPKAVGLYDPSREWVLAG